MSTSSPLANLPEGYTLEQPSTPQPQQGEVPGLPAGYKLETADTQQQQSTPPGLTDGGSVPNARIRNLPNPAAGSKTAGDALLNGMKTGAQLAAIPAAAAGMGEAVEGAEGLTTSVVDKAKTIVGWAKTNPLKAYAISKIADELGIHPFDLM